MISFDTITRNAILYAKFSLGFFTGVPLRGLVFGASFLFALIGFVRRIRTDHHMVVFSGMTIVVSILWPTFAGMRQLFPVFPFYFWFVVWGLVEVSSSRTWRAPLLRKAVCSVWVILILFSFGTSSIETAQLNFRNSRVMPFGPNTEEAQRMFYMVRTNASEEAVIVFFKPRVMRMMTGRKALMINQLEEMDRGDFLVWVEGEETDQQITLAELSALRDSGRVRSVSHSGGFEVLRIVSPADLPAPVSVGVEAPNER